MTNEPVEQPATMPDNTPTAWESSPGVAAESDVATVPAEPSAPMRSTGPLRALSIIVMVAGALLVIAGSITWFVVLDQLADEKIVVSEDAPRLGGSDVNGPFS